MRFGQQLKKLREAAGLSQPGLAEKSGISLWNIRNWEQGRRQPSWRALLDLAGALGVQAEAFAECEDGPSNDEEPLPDPVQAKPVADPIPRPSAATVKGHKARPAKGKATDQEPPAAKGEAKKTRKRKGG